VAGNAVVLEILVNAEIPLRSVARGAGAEGGGIFHCGGAWKIVRGRGAAGAREKGVRCRRHAGDGGGGWHVGLHDKRPDIVGISAAGPSGELGIDHRNGSRLRKRRTLRLDREEKEELAVGQYGAPYGR